MSNVLRVIDVVDIGIEKEKARRDFYDQVARHFNDEEMKTLFTRLRDWEANHIKKFESIKKTVEQVGTIESYEGELAAYINALVDDRLYSEVQPESFSQHVTDPVVAIQYGIGFEKDAIMLFMELLPFVQGKNKTAIEDLIHEERQHVLQLIKMRNKYTGADS